MSAMCGAKARTNHYNPCRQPAMANGRCRFHGGKSSGPRTEEGKKRIIAVRTKHGHYSTAAIENRKHVQEFIKISESSLREKKEFLSR